MEHYAAILNLEDVDSYCLQRDELFDPEIQDTVSRSVLLGYGQTEYAALTAALNALQDNGMLKTYKCELGAGNILESSSGKNALPGHSSAVAFCRKYDLSEEATEELSFLIDALLDLNK